MSQSPRPQCYGVHIDEAEIDSARHLRAKLEEKGRGILLSSHECLGVIKEEFDEYAAAVHNNDREAQYKELMDIVVAAEFAMISMKSNQMHW